MKAATPKMAYLVRAAVAAVAAMALVLTSTYAWFTSNRIVEADTVSIRSGMQDLRLELSSSENGPFAQQGNIQAISTAEVLQPVSTADLVSFFCNTSMQDEQATTFALTEDGYYHGRIFLRADGTGLPEGTQVQLYLDQTGIVVNEPEDTAGLMRNAARVGLTFSHTAEGSRTVILNLSAEHNGEKDTYANTLLGGQTQPGEVVLGNSGGRPIYQADPSVPQQTYALGDNDVLPEEPMTTIALNQVVPVDVYYYLEGCDTDCTNAVRTTEMSVQLFFYGVLSTGGVAE